MNLAIFAAALLAPAQINVNDDYTAAYERSFRAAFRTNAIEQCVSPAKGAAVAHIEAAANCACVVDKLLATKSVKELSQPASAAELLPLAVECIKAHPPQGQAVQH